QISRGVSRARRRIHFANATRRALRRSLATHLSMANRDRRRKPRAIDGRRDPPRPVTPAVLPPATLERNVPNERGIWEDYFSEAIFLNYSLSGHARFRSMA